MQVSNAYPVYNVGSNALQLDNGVAAGDASRQQHLREVYRRPPAEQVLEGELLDKQRQQRPQDRVGTSEETAAEQQRYQQQAASRALASGLRAAQALAEYQENAELSAGSVIRERSNLLDVYA